MGDLIHYPPTTQFTLQISIFSVKNVFKKKYIQSKRAPTTLESAIIHNNSHRVSHTTVNQQQPPNISGLQVQNMCKYSSINIDKSFMILGRVDYHEHIPAIKSLPCYFHSLLLAFPPLHHKLNSTEQKDHTNHLLQPRVLQKKFQKFDIYLDPRNSMSNDG
jgi:hypothetical protein